MAEPVRFLSVEDVLAIHADTIEHEGGAPGLVSSGLLDSAVTMPQQRVGGSFLHEGFAAMAAAYLFHIAQNHAFQDGNKRTAVLAALVFLDVNGVEDLPDPDDIESVTMDVAAGRMTKDELTRWLGERVDR